MPTLPPGPSASESHRARQVAESFGADPEQYDRTRPRYPQALVEAVVAASLGPDVLDVGIGTGVSARPFRAAGCRVLGVEVDARMAEFARHSGLDVEVAKFEEWDPAGRSFDAVLAGQAWHWVDSVVGATKAAGVLRPGGRLAVFWNVLELARDPRQMLADVYCQVLPDTPFFGGVARGLDAYAAQFTRAADGIRQAGRFGEPEQWRFDWERTYTTAEWLDQVPTFGGHRQLPPDKLRELLAGMEVAIDAMGGSFTAPYSAVVVTAVRTA